MKFECKKTKKRYHETPINIDILSFLEGDVDNFLYVELPNFTSYFLQAQGKLIKIRLFFEKNMTYK